MHVQTSQIVPVLPMPHVSLQQTSQPVACMQ